MLGNYNDCHVETTSGSSKGKKYNKHSYMKNKNLGPTDGITKYVAGWKLTLEPDGNAYF